jgi:predicted ArsR family transcriptional regulator
MDREIGEEDFMAGHWNKRFFANTRGKIITLLRRASRTVNELAEALDLTDNAVRAHLTSLERDGLVEQSGSQRGHRKPHLTYALTTDASVLFPKAYGTLFDALLKLLRERASAEEVDDLLREMGRRLAAEAAERMEGKSRKERIEKALELLEGMGGLAEVEEREGELYIRGCDCPLSAAVEGNPQVCRVAESFLSEVIGVPVREKCLKGSSPRCRFEIVTTEAR